MSKSLLAYQLPAHVRFKLAEAGFTTVDDLQNIGSFDLSKEAEISREEATNVLDLVFPSSLSKTSCDFFPNVKTALQLLEKERSATSIVTFCKKLDEILDGGIPLGKLIEVCGTPGIGKTQLCLQLCVAVQIRNEFGGISGEAIFIDTVGSFSVTRLSEIAAGAVEHCQQLAMHKSEDITVESFLKGIYYYQCCNYVELIAIINLLQFEIESKSKVRLVVVDSIAFHFRYGFDGNFSERTLILGRLAQSLVKLAHEKNIAIVMTNEMTTRFDNGSSSYLCPALGESWSYSCAMRLLLFWEQAHRKALIYKSSSKAENAVTFDITRAGIRDVVNLCQRDSDYCNISDDNCGTSLQNENSRKRPRSNS